MKDEGIRPNSLSFISVLAACRHSGLVEEGRKYFKSMTEDYLIIPGIEHWISMVDLFGRHGKLMEAFEFIENMPIEPDVDVWRALLGVCGIHRNIELAERVAPNVYQFSSQNVGFYVTTINIYAKASRWDDVTRLRKLLDEMEVKRLRGQSVVR